MRRNLLLVFILLCLALSSAAALAAHADAVQGEDAPGPNGGLRLLGINSPPLAMHSHGRITGLAVEVVREAARRAGSDVELTLEPSYAVLERGWAEAATAAFPVLRTPRNEGRYKWVGPLAHERVSFYALRDSGIVLTGLEAARHVNGIAVEEGGPAAQHLRELGFSNLVPHAGAVQCADSLRYGRVDLWLVSDMGMASLARLAGADPDGFRKVYEVAELPAYIAFSERAGDALVRRWQSALDAMRADETFDRLQARWSAAFLRGGLPVTDGPDGLRLSREERAWISANRTVTAGGVQDFPPLEFMDGEGRWVGFAADILRLVEERTGLVFKLDLAPTWAEALAKARSGRVQMVAGIVRTPERESYLRFTQPYFSTPSVIITRVQTPFLTGLDDLEGKKTAVVRGFYTQERLRSDHPLVKQVVEDNVLDALLAVSTGKAFAYMGDLASATYYIRTAGLTNLKVAARTAYRTDALGMAVHPEETVLFGILQKALASISAAERDAIFEKWVNLPAATDGRVDKVWRVVGWAALPLAVGLAVLLWWARRLRQEVARRAAAEERLAERERGYRNLFENAQTGILLMDVGGRQLVSANRRMAELFGHESAQAFLEAENAELLCESVDDLLDRHADVGRRVFTMCCEITRADGSEAWLDWAGSLDVETGLATVVAQDVTEPRAAELALREQEGMMRALVDSIPLFVAYLGPDRRFRLISPHGAEMLGYSVEDIVGRHMSEVIPPEVWAVFKPYEDRALAGEYVQVAVETDYARQDGHYLAYYVPQLDPRGAVLGMAVCLVDITDLKRTEADLRASEERYRSVVERSNDAIVIVSVEGRLLYGNSKAAELFGYSLEEARGMSVRRFFPDEEWPRVSAILTRPDELTYETRMLDREGNLLHVENSRALIIYEGQPSALVIVRDVTRRKRSERLLKDSQERLQMALDGTDLGLWEYHPESDVLELPEKLFVRRYGYVQDNIPRTSSQWLAVVHPEDRPRAQKLYRAFIEGGVEKLAYEYRVRDGRGEWRWIAVQGRALERGADGRPKRLLGMVQDITQRKNAENKLRELATLDSLTGLANRRYFLENAGRELSRAKRYRTPLSLVMLDADRFKRINDTYGHDVGDEVLRAIAAIGGKGIRDVDLFGRIGGEEFALLLPETGRERAVEVAERLRGAYEDHVVQAGDGGEVRFTVSFGVAEALPADSVDTLLRRADEAMYAAKEAGRNAVREA